MSFTRRSWILAPFFLPTMWAGPWCSLVLIISSWQGAEMAHSRFKDMAATPGDGPLRRLPARFSA